MNRPDDGWIVAVPLKPAGSRKTRLAARLDGATRDRLAAAMFGHVVATIAQVPGVRVVPVCETAPDGWAGAWHRDEGAGLNEALAGLRTAHGDASFAVIHADLPRLAADDVTALLVAGQTGLALAPDRHGGGTNALAVAAGRPLAFRFGPGSLARFSAESGGAAVLVRRPGLALDIDTPADLDLAGGETDPA
ncbi:2-phospho-L-lactate guanylyltransferase [Sphingomonas solaris]|uniref:2-phospho-L-lactate guanylyltransferase n=1 Tax=Alterirhizorhabdus solaris TaxID=2529389 RepID=A0A558RBM5_9SPHN|nr:2-phospho-L-lactate guanylyltransferase [Sphingomonas solaris]TVV76825.1 2-phospho-L-lactate guanylyltransferase [Sphingomonas solaris]